MEARQSPGLWHRVEGGALPACMAGKKGAEMLRKMRQTPHWVAGRWSVEAHQIQAMKTSLHPGPSRQRAWGWVARRKERVMGAGEQSQQSWTAQRLPTSRRMAPRGVPTGALSTAALRETPVRSH